MPAGPRVGRQGGGPPRAPPCSPTGAVFSHHSYRQDSRRSGTSGEYRAPKPAGGRWTCMQSSGGHCDSGSTCSGSSSLKTANPARRGRSAPCRPGRTPSSRIKPGRSSSARCLAACPEGLTGTCTSTLGLPPRSNSACSSLRAGPPRLQRRQPLGGQLSSARRMAVSTSEICCSSIGCPLMKKVGVPLTPSC